MSSTIETTIKVVTAVSTLITILGLGTIVGIPGFRNIASYFLFVNALFGVYWTEEFACLALIITTLISGLFVIVGCVILEEEPKIKKQS